MSVYKHKSIKVDKFELGTVNKSSAGSKKINIFYGDNNWYLQTPKFRIPFDPYPDNFCISVTSDFEKKMQEIDEWVKFEAERKSLEWFGEVISKDKIEDLYEPLCNCSNPKYPSFMKMRFHNKCGYINEQGENIGEDLIKRGKEVKLLLQLKSIYIPKDNSKIKIIYSMEKLMLYDPKEEKQEYAFIDDDE